MTMKGRILVLMLGMWLCALPTYAVVIEEMDCRLGSKRPRITAISMLQHCLDHRDYVELMQYIRTDTEHAGPKGLWNFSLYVRDLATRKWTGPFGSIPQTIPTNAYVQLQVSMPTGTPGEVFLRRYIGRMTYWRGEKGLHFSCESGGRIQ